MGDAAQRPGFADGFPEGAEVVHLFLAAAAAGVDAVDHGRQNFAHLGEAAEDVGACRHDVIARNELAHVQVAAVGELRLQGGGIALQR